MVSSSLPSRRFSNSNSSWKSQWPEQLTCASPNPNSIFSSDSLTRLAFTRSTALESDRPLLFRLPRSKSERLVSSPECSFFSVSSPRMTFLVLLMISSCVHLRLSPNDVDIFSPTAGAVWLDETPSNGSSWIGVVTKTWRRWRDELRLIQETISPRLPTRMAQICCYHARRIQPTLLCI